MISRLIAVADHASISDNKLNVMGIFGIIPAPDVPCQHPLMWLVAQLEFDALDAGDKPVVISVIGPDGEVVLEVEGVMTVPEAADGQPVIVHQLVQMPGMVFPRFGRYDFKIRVADEPEMAVPVTVVRSKPG